MHFVTSTQCHKLHRLQQRSLVLYNRLASRSTAQTPASHFYVVGNRLDTQVLKRFYCWMKRQWRKLLPDIILASFLSSFRSSSQQCDVLSLFASVWSNDDMEQVLHAIDECQTVVTCEINTFWNTFEIISVFCFTSYHVWNWNRSS